MLSGLLVDFTSSGSSGKTVGKSIICRQGQGQGQGHELEGSPYEGTNEGIINSALTMIKTTHLLTEAALKEHNLTQRENLIII